MKRQVIMYFASFRYWEKATMSCGKLKDTRFIIREQFPREVIERHRILYTAMKRALQNIKKKRESMILNKLYINCIRITSPSSVAR